MGVGQGETGEGDSGLLTSGEQFHLLEASHACYAEGAQVSAVFLVGFSGVVLGHETNCTGVEIECVDVMLSEETDSETWILGN